MQKHQNRRKTQRKQGGKTKKSSASKTGKKGTRFNRLKKLFSTSTYESSPAADAIKIKRAAALPFFNTYKSLAIKEGRLMPSMVTPVRI
jgi:hypothetical protein